jgi:hypothetical protein
MSEDISDSAFRPVTVGEVEQKAARDGTDESVWTQLNICFVLTTAVGCVAELCGSQIFAGGAMLVYLGFGFGFRDKTTNYERFGDSTYYQGFILTLFALLVALTGKGVDKLTSDAIINQFGLAIITTFIGMSGRIIIIQFFTSAADLTDDVKKSVAEYITGLNREIAGTLAEIKKLRETLLESSSAITIDLQREAAKAMVVDSSGVKATTAEFVAALKKSMTSLNSSLESVVRKINAVEVPADALSGEIQKAAGAIREQLDQVRQTLLTEGDRFKDALSDNATLLKDTQTSLRNMNRTISDASEITSKTLATTEAGLETAKTASSAVGQLAVSAAGLAAHLTDLSRALDAKALDFTKGLADASDTITEVAKARLEEAQAVVSALELGTRSIIGAIGEARHLSDDAHQ